MSAERAEVGLADLLDAISREAASLGEASEQVCSILRDVCAMTLRAGELRREAQACDRLTRGLLSVSQKLAAVAAAVPASQQVAVAGDNRALPARSGQAASRVVSS